MQWETYPVFGCRGTRYLKVRRYDALSGEWTYLLTPDGDFERVFSRESDADNMVKTLNRVE